MCGKFLGTMNRPKSNRCQFFLALASPGNLCVGALFERRSWRCTGHNVVSAQLEQSLSILVHFAHTEGLRVVICAHSGIEVAQKNKLFIVGPLRNMAARFSCTELFFCVRCGAYTLTRVTGAAVVPSRRVRIRPEPLLFCSIMLGRRFLTAKHTACTLCAPRAFPLPVKCVVFLLQLL